MSWVALLGSYLLGSIPTSYVIAKKKAGLDIRQVGSGNVGATNVARVLGKGLGLAVLIVDAGKGWVAMRWLGGLTPSLEWQLACGAAAILGHIWTPWLKFHGGKGVATSMGVLLAWSPQVLGILALLFGITLFCTHVVSIASVSCAAALPIALVITGHSRAEIAFGLALGALVIYTHRTNLRRLLRGEEKRLP